MVRGLLPTFHFPLPPCVCLCVLRETHRSAVLHASMIEGGVNCFSQHHTGPHISLSLLLFCLFAVCTHLSIKPQSFYCAFSLIRPCTKVVSFTGKLDLQSAWNSKFDGSYITCHSHSWHRASTALMLTHLNGMQLFQYYQ